MSKKQRSISEVVARIEQLVERLAAAQPPLPRQAPAPEPTPTLVDRILTEGQSIRPAPIVGWRCWRILPFTTLAGEKTIRLAQVGTRGGSGAWEPFVPARAICADRNADHEAPSVTHWSSENGGCGLWGIADEKVARDRLQMFVGIFELKEQPLAWAFGQVSLWGRVIEHEHGYRAQYGYPLTIEVHSADELLARRLAGAYGVETSWAGPGLLVNDWKEEAPGEPLNLGRELVTMSKRITNLVEILTPEPPKTYEDWKLERAEEIKRDRQKALDTLPPIPAGALSDDQIMLALLYETSIHWQAQQRGRRELAARPQSHLFFWDSTRILGPNEWDPFAEAPHFDSNSVTKAYLQSVGYHHRLAWAHPGWEGLRRRVYRQLHAMAKGGLLDEGVLTRNYHQFVLTDAGIARLGELGPPARIRVTTPWHPHRGKPTRRRRISTRGGLAHLRVRRTRMFEHEVTASRPGWTADRRAAQARGEADYIAWVEAAREDTAVTRLRFDLDEVERALSGAVAKNGGEPVVFSAVWAILCPLKATKGEASSAAQQLVRLRKAGRAVNYEPTTDRPYKAWNVLAPALDTALLDGIDSARDDRDKTPSTIQSTQAPALVLMHGDRPQGDDDHDA